MWGFGKIRIHVWPFFNIWYEFLTLIETLAQIYRELREIML